MKFWQKRFLPPKGSPSESSGQPKESESILLEQIETGLKEYNRPKHKLFVSALTAGMEVGFSVLLMGTLYTLFSESLSEARMHLVIALAYPIGFLFVVIGRSELFTEHTTLAVLPVLGGRATVSGLLLVWGVVYVGNLLGGYTMGGLLVLIGPALGAVSEPAFKHLAEAMVYHDSLTILGSGALAGWLMGLLGWLVTASQETISRMLAVILITIVIGIAGLHHSIVGSIEVFTGFLVSPEITYSLYGHFQLYTTLGNVIGGVVFVALFKYGQSAPR